MATIKGTLCKCPYSFFPGHNLSSLVGVLSSLWSCPTNTAHTVEKGKKRSEKTHEYSFRRFPNMCPNPRREGTRSREEPLICE